jgi:hypothetical protein
MTDIAHAQFSLTAAEQEAFWNRYDHNRIATHTTTGRPLRRA